MKKHANPSFMLIAISAVAFLVTMMASAESPSPIPYEDPIIGKSITRITLDAGEAGENNCVNFLAAAAGASSNWSQDSQRIVYTRSCEGDPSQNGIYVYDVNTKQSTCIAKTSKHWTYPIFDHSHTGDIVYYIDGSDLWDNENNNKPYAIYKALVDFTSTQQCEDYREPFIHIQELSGNTTKRIVLLTKNNIDDGGDPLFATHVEHPQGGIRTIIFTPAGSLLGNWDLDNGNNPPHNDTDDGDTSVWSPHNSTLIYTNRRTNTGRPGVWSVSIDNEDQPQLQYEPFVSNRNCHLDDHGDSIEVAHSAWGWHRQADGSIKDIFIGADRCVWTQVTDASNTIISQTQNNDDGFELHGQLHLSFDPFSFDGELSNIRFVADEYISGSGAEPFLYNLTLGDIGISDENPSPYSSWSGVREDKKLAWHRNKFVGLTGGQQAFEPHPQFSPNGQYVLWQSNSLTQFNNLNCTNCGEYGGENSNILFTDLYLVRTGDGQPEPTPVPPPSNTGTLIDFDANPNWRDYGYSNGVAHNLNSGYLTVNYNLPENKYATVYTDDLLVNNWTSYGRIKFDFKGEGTGRTIKFLINDAEIDNSRYEFHTATFVDSSSNWRPIEIPFNQLTRNDWQPPNAPNDGLTLANITRIAYEIKSGDNAILDKTFQFKNIELATAATPPTPTPSPTSTPIPPTPTPLPPPPPSGTAYTLETFENGVSDWRTYRQNSDNGIQLSTTSDDESNNSLQISYQMPAYGYVAAYTDALSLRDWRNYESVEFAFYGQNTGNQHTFALYDGELDGAYEIYTTSFIDNETGWRTVPLPLDSFTRGSYQPSNAPDDGLTLTHIGRIVIQTNNTASTSSNRSVRVDDVKLRSASTTPLIDFTVNTDWRNWGSGDVNVTLSASSLTANYDLAPYKYVAVYTDDLLVNNWSRYQAIQFDFKGKNTGREVEFMLYASNGIYTQTFMDNSSDWRPIELSFDEFLGDGNPNLTNITRIVYQLGKLDTDAQNSFQLREIELVE